MKESYLYDASGRLVSRASASGDAEVLVYDGLHMVQAYDDAGALSWAASWGPGVDRLLSVEKQGAEYFALDDGKGSVVAWLDSASNTVPARAEYTPEGRGKYFNEAAGTDCTESGNTRCGNHLGLPFGFHSAFVAKQSGLLYFRNRWYSTEANQWLSQDPLDFVDSFDLYAFNAFDAVNHRDPLGLSSKGVATEGEDLPVYAPCSVLDPNCRKRGGGEGGNRADGTGGGGAGKKDEDNANQAATAALLAQMDRHAKEGPRAVVSSAGVGTSPVSALPKVVLAGAQPGSPRASVRTPPPSAPTSGEIPSGILAAMRHLMQAVNDKRYRSGPATNPAWEFSTAIIPDGMGGYRHTAPHTDGEQDTVSGYRPKDASALMHNHPPESNGRSIAVPSISDFDTMKSTGLPLYIIGGNEGSLDNPVVNIVLIRWELVPSGSFGSRMSVANSALEQATLQGVAGNRSSAEYKWATNFSSFVQPTAIHVEDLGVYEGL